MAYTNLEGKLDPDTIQADYDTYKEIERLINTATASHDEKDSMREQLAGFVSVSEAQTMIMVLNGKQLSPLEKVRNGNTPSATEITKAVKQRGSDEA